MPISKEPYDRDDDNESRPSNDNPAVPQSTEEVLISSEEDADFLELERVLSEPSEDDLEDDDSECATLDLQSYRALSRKGDV